MKSAARKPPPDSASWRMLACHNFVSQDVFVTEDNDIIAMCAAKDKLLIATSRMSVEVRDLNSKGLLLFAFPTTDQVQMIDFCEGANFVLTLEKKVTRSVDVFHLRAYFNWWVEPCNQVPKTREAGSEPQGNGTSDRRLEIVELPTKRHGVSCIGCCRQSGTTLVAAGDTISVFILKTQYDKTRRQLYNDFELLMTLKIGFHPTSVNVCEDHVACCSHSELLVFKIKLEAEAKSSESSIEAATGSQKKKHVSFSTKEGSLVDDQSHINLKFESEDNIEWADASGELELKAVLHPSCFPVELTLKSASKSRKNEDSDTVILGPRVNPPAACKVGVVIDPDTDLVSSADEVSAVTLLYRKFCAKDGGNLITFHWVPYYINDSMSHPLTEAMSVVPKTVSFVLHSRMFTKLKTLACLVSSGKCGYLYRLSSTPRLVSIYKYSKEARSIAVDSLFLHALTSASLETYTLPVPFEPTESSEAYKSVMGKPALMVGLRPFLGLKTLLMSDQHLILAAASSAFELMEQSSCTLYSLMKPAVNQFFYDLKEAASLHSSEKEVSYVSAVKQGFYLLNLSISLQGRYSCSSELLSAYSDACCVLGDAFLKSEQAAERDKAALYYSFSEECLETIVNRVLFFKGLIHKNTLTRTVVQFIKMTYDQSVLSAKKLKPVSPKLADNILEIVREECPEYLHKLVLCSGIAAFSSEKALTLLKENVAYRQGQGHAADSLAIVQLLLRDGNVEAAQGMLKTLSKEYLMPVLLELHDLVHWSQSITQLGEMIKATRPDVYFSLLVHLKNNGVMSPEQIVLILQHASPQAEPHCVPLLREFLEATLSSKRTNTQAYPHLLVTLVKTYLGKMAPYSGSGSPQQAPLQLVHTKSSTLFGNRPAWLLELPPFLGRPITKTCNQYSTTMNLAECCICSNCWDELLRMQSLLCSDLPSASLRSQVLELLEMFSLSESENYISLKVLCLPPIKALSILLKLYPSAVLGFMETKFPEDSSEWVSLYTAVNNKLQAASKKKKAAVYKSIIEGVLSYLSDALTPQQLVDLLPPGKEEYTDYVRQCMERYQAKLLREKIIALGTELKDMM